MSKLQGIFVQYRIHRSNLSIFGLDKGAFFAKNKIAVLELALLFLFFFL
jgi:hypothetical protein